MAYTKTSWNETVPITPEKLNNLESQYDKAKSDIDTHANASAPHAGHATTQQLTDHNTDPNAHAGTFISQSTLDSHTNASAPHSGHATTTALNSHTSASAPHSGHATTSALSTTNTNLSNHTGAAAPHSGHVKGTMTITVSLASAPPANPKENDIWIVL